ncbi:helix-turn-helix transcriptional regulator [Pseudonocardia sp. MCCB 268]|nr:helix-turn-helix transcriptional regulator [Pseudonocardia cytotoxica]
MREVADLAGINRGLVYHHFGSRGSCCARPTPRQRPPPRRLLALQEAVGVRRADRGCSASRSSRRAGIARRDPPARRADESG